VNLVEELLSREQVEKLAKPAQVRNGEELAKAGMVELVEVNPQEVKARVKGLTPGASTRKTELVVKNGRLNWRCTCTKNPNNFCKYLVATALETWRKSP